MRNLGELRDALLEICREARELGEHQVAYHALAGSLHAAESLRQSDVLDQVGALAAVRVRLKAENLTRK